MSFWRNQIRKKGMNRFMQFDTTMFRSEFVDLPKIPFRYYPKGSSNLIDDQNIFKELNISSSIESNIVTVELDGSANSSYDLKFYYILELDKLIVSFQNCSYDSDISYKIFTVKNSISKLIWNIIKEYSDYAYAIDRFSKTYLNLDIDLIKKFTKFSDVYARIFNLNFELMRLGNTSKEVTIASYLDYHTLDKIVDSIPSEVADMACEFQNVTDILRLQAYFSFISCSSRAMSGDYSKVAMIAIPVSDEYFFPIVIDYPCGDCSSEFSTTILTMLDDVSSDVYDGCVMKNRVEGDLYDLSYKVNPSILSKIMKSYYGNMIK